MLVLLEARCLIVRENGVSRPLQESRDIGCPSPYFLVTYHEPYQTEGKQRMSATETSQTVGCCLN